jgi:hypothetical protein
VAVGSGSLIAETVDMAFTCCVIEPGGTVEHVEVIQVSGSPSIVMMYVLVWSCGIHHIFPGFTVILHVIPSLGAFRGPWASGTGNPDYVKIQYETPGLLVIG